MDMSQHASASASKPGSSHHAMEENSDAVENSSTISRVCQRVTVHDDDDDDANGDASCEIWALMEFAIPHPEMPEAEPLQVYKKWKRFDCDSDLSDFIRRDSGEPLTLPPYSLSPAQSLKIQQEARHSVSQVTEEFRRFRVRAEVARKQADAQIRDLQNNKMQSAQRRIEGQDLVRIVRVCVSMLYESLYVVLVLPESSTLFPRSIRKLSWNKPGQSTNSWSVFEQKWLHKRRNGRKHMIC